MCVCACVYICMNTMLPALLSGKIFCLKPAVLLQLITNISKQIFYLSLFLKFLFILRICVTL